MKIMTRFAILLMATALSACTMAPDYERPQVSNAAWRNVPPPSESSSSLAQADWWQLYQDDQLDALIEQGLRNNHSLNASLSRIEQARADLRIAGAALLPSASLATSGSQSDVLNDASDSRPFSIMQNGGFAARDWIGGATISYELDLFGKNRSREAAYRARFDQAQFDDAALRLVVATEIARTYFYVQTTIERKTIAEQRRQNAALILESLVADQSIGSDVTRAVAAQKSILSDRLAELAAVSLAEEKAKNALAVLVGSPPQTFYVQGTNLAHIKIATIAPLQPTQLLERRPDLMAAEERLKAANADIGAVKAALYPSITLGAGLAAAQPIIGSPSTIAAMIGSITAPLFEGGRLSGQLDKAEAQKIEQTEQYLHAVLNAYREIEDALAAMKWTTALSDHRQSSTRNRELALTIASDRFTAGTLPIRTILQDKDALLIAQDKQVTASFAKLSASIDLIKAMGGGWSAVANELNGLTKADDS